MERVKVLINNEDLSTMSNNSGPASLATSNALKIFLTRKQEMDQVLETSNHAEQQSKNNDSSPLAPKQAWLDQDLSLEDASIIEDVEEIPKDREREPQSMTGKIGNWSIKKILTFRFARLEKCPIRACLDNFLSIISLAFFAFGNLLLWRTTCSSKCFSCHR